MNIPEHTRQALEYASETLRNCAPEQRSGIWQWINQLLDSCRD